MCTGVDIIWVNGLTNNKGFTFKSVCGFRFNNRYDCGVKYFLKVALMDKKRNKLPEWKVKLDGQRPEGPHEWEKLEHTFREYPAGVRYIQFKDYGEDTYNWAGFYGAKLAGATVRFLLD